MNRGSANVLKIVFGLYAIYAAVVSAQTAVRHLLPRYWIWAGLSLCLLPVAWGLIREKKWAWNAAAGLVIFQLVWVCGQMAGMFLSQTISKASLVPVALRTTGIALGKFLVLFVLLVLARRFYQTAFAPAANAGELPGKTNSYVRPVLLGVLFLVTGLLVFLHPIATQFSPIGLRVLAAILAGALWLGAVLCFFERRVKMVRYHARFATVLAAVGMLGSLAFYAYFALAGLIIGGVQLCLGIAAMRTAAKAPACFVD